MREIRIDENSLTRSGKRKMSEVRDVEVPSEEMGFEVKEIRDDIQHFEEEIANQIREPGEQVKVRFDKFVQLVATHNFEEVLKDHAEEDIIMNSNLLMDLASAHEDTDDGKRQSTLVGVGIVIGVIVALVLFKLL